MRFYYVRYFPGLVNVAGFEGGGERDISRYAALGVGKELLTLTFQGHTSQR
jgi:hypothetical protein